MAKKTNIVFMGTPDISVPTLEALHHEYNVSSVVTIPDKIQGRGMKLLPSPVKTKAIELGLPVLQPENLKDADFIATLNKLKPDIIVVFAFRYLPKEVYDIAKIAAFNIHTSLLPEFRGAAPINWAIINGEPSTGLTSFILEDKIDAGQIILQEEIIIPYNATAGDLYDIMMKKAPNFALKTCELLLTEKHTLTTQAEQFRFPAPKLLKQNVKIHWQYHAISVVNFINGCSPDPCAWTMWNDKKLQILRAKVPTELDISINIEKIVRMEKFGEFCITNGKFFVNCMIGILELQEIRLENKNTMLIKDFINGYRGELVGTFN